MGSWDCGVLDEGVLDEICKENEATELYKWHNQHSTSLKKSVDCMPVILL
jgi:uncharacterized protein HemY